HRLMSTFFPDQLFWQYVTYGPAQGPNFYSGFEQAQETLQQKLRELAPVDGVIGFSQGSNLALHLAGRASIGTGAPLSFVVHLAGTHAETHGYHAFFKEPFSIPSLHVHGRIDKFTKDKGAALAH
ncbi:unnamed protein product, partial [Polarella glacialis]